MSLQGTVSYGKSLDRRLALVEIGRALNALHLLFSTSLRLPPRPMKRSRFSLVESESPHTTATYKAAVSRIAAARDKSLQFSACDDLSDLGSALANYRRFIDWRFEMEDTQGAVFAAALAVRRQVHELCSIHAIAFSHPASALFRAKRISGKCRR